MSSWQIALNIPNVEVKRSPHKISESKKIAQRSVGPPIDWINLELMITSFWKVTTTKEFNFLNLRNSLPKKIWPQEKKIFLNIAEQKLSNGVYGDIELAIRLLRYCLVHDLLLLPGCWNKLEDLVTSFSYGFISKNEKLVQSSRFKTDKLSTFCLKSTKKISFYDPQCIINDKFKLFWAKNGTPRLGKDIKRIELFGLLWNHQTNIIFNKTTITPVASKKKI